MYKDINIDDAKTLFANCILRHKGLLVYSGEIARLPSGVLGTNVFDLPLKKGLGLVPLTDFDTAPPLLGYFNHKGAAYFVRRKPMRQYSVGMKTECVEVKCPELYKDVDARDACRLKSEGLEDCDKNIYPTLTKALNDLNKNEATSVGVTREFSVDNQMKLYYRANFVGILNADNGSAAFLGNKVYLKYVWKPYAT